MRSKKKPYNPKKYAQQSKKVPDNPKKNMPDICPADILYHLLSVMYFGIIFTNSFFLVCGKLFVNF